MLLFFLSAASPLPLAFWGVNVTILLIKMNLSEIEEMISKVESFHHQPYLWDLLYSLPWLQTESLQEHGVEYLSMFLKTIQK